MIQFEKYLNSQQLKAVNQTEGAILILAGAGSGKTRVITCRITHMLQKGIPQSAILALTFTNKAAREMENRVKEMTGKKLFSLTVSTFHAFGVKILREEIGLLGYRENFSIYDSTDKLELIKESLRECKLYPEAKVSGRKVDLKKLETLFSNVKLGLLRWGRPGLAAASFADAGFADNTWEKVYDEYQKSLKVYNALDFDDLLLLPIELFGGYPEILEKYRKRYRYIMVDEFQDTSLIQYKLLSLLANPKSGKSNICVVGDDDQSIYSWRGANFGNFLLFEKDFPNLLEIKLEENYRSTTTILEAANGLISHNTSRKGKTLWSGNGEGKPIIVSLRQNERDEASFIAGTIKKLRFSERLNYGSFGVLVRTNGQFDCIEEAFLAENIPYRVSGGLSFFDRKEIRDILSYLRVIANHHDDVNLLRIINTPRRGIGKASIKSAADLSRRNNSSLYDSFFRIKAARQSQKPQELFQTELTYRWLDQNEEAKTRAKTGESGIEEFLELIQSSKEEFLSGGALSKKTRAFVDKIDYWSYLVSEHSNDEKKARWKFANIEYLAKMIEAWENDPDNLDKGLYAYLNRISLLARTDGEEETDREGDSASRNHAGKVNLMTIHASKGLEFPVVFIAGAEDGLIPHEKSIAETSGVENPVSLEEERRLFYVAITRAQDKLYITSCHERSRRESTSDCSPSPFLEEIPAHLIEYQEDEEAADEQEDAEIFFARMKERFK